MNIVSLPGLDGTGELPSDVEDILTSRHSVSVVQYPPELHRYMDLQAWLENILPKDDFIIVAESFSGPLAIMLASADTAGLKGIVFVATFAKTSVRVPLFLTHTVEIMPIKSRLLTGVAQPLLMGRWSRRDFTEKFRRAMKLVPAKTIAGRLREALNADAVEQLRRLSLPSIYLQATQDRLVPPEMSLDFGRAACEILKIDGRHFLLQAKPSQSADQIMDFAARFD
ncbi:MULTISPECIES: alpha/beta hydrolase [unclassified Rhizobium]|uniref:alpha/beta fold hydrolase n=1 Tax=unclassified Rhizobium TaxID=2613769 RepID=UPI000A428FB3|nr:MULTISPECIES: alpha/beta hydrolase [unclassified Rhizobium]